MLTYIITATQMEYPAASNVDTLNVRRDKMRPYNYLGSEFLEKRMRREARRKHMDLVKYCTDEIARHTRVLKKDPTHLVMNAETLSSLFQQIRERSCIRETRLYQNPSTFMGLPIIVANNVSGVYAGYITT